MAKKFLLTLLALCTGLVVLLGAAFVWREPLIRVVATHALADTGIAVTALRGLHLHSGRASLDNLSLRLPSQQQLALSGITVQFSLTALSQVPTINTLAITSATLQGEAVAGLEPTADGTLLLSDILQLLREFPLREARISDISIAQWPETLNLTLQHVAGKLSVAASSGPLSVSAGFSQADATQAAQIEAALTRGDTGIGDFTATLQPQGDAYALAGAGHLAFANLNALLSELHQGELDLPLQSASLDWTLAGTVADDLRGNRANSAAGDFTVGVQAGSRLTLAAGLAPELDELTLNFTDTAELHLSTGASLGIALARLPLQLRSQLNRQALEVDALVSLDQCLLTLSAACKAGFDGQARLGDYGFTGALTLALPNLSGASGSYHLTTTNLVIHGLPALVPGFDVDASVEVDGAAVSFNTPLLLREVPGAAGLTLSGRYVLATGVATGVATLPELSFTDAAPLSAWFGDWPYAGDVLTGSVELRLQGSWQPALTSSGSGMLKADVAGSLRELGGAYESFFFRGLNGALQASIETGERFMLTTPPLALTLAGADVGVTLENVRLNMAMDGAAQVLQLQELSAAVLGGSVSASDITYDFNAERNAVPVHFDGLQLARMLALANYDAVQATGAVSGLLPFVVTSTGVEMADGTLQSDAPGGTIRYTDAAAAGLGGNAGLDLVSQVLGNFQYSSLSSSIDYSPAGELMLGMKLQGYSPDLGSDQPINLNLNLTDNIPALLESLQAARDIEAFLEGYHPSP